MSGYVRISNLDKVLQGFDLTDARVDQAALIATTQAALAIEAQAKANANTGSHAPGEPHIGPRTGEGPNIVTGNLVNNIKVSPATKGLRGYTAIVGSSAEYARAIELGNPVWKSGVKFPYLTPAANKLSSSGVLNRIFTTAFIRVVKG
jgi:hypothetical protein